MSIITRNDFELMAQTPLFSGLSIEEIELIAQRLPCRIKEYKKGEVMMLSGDPVPTCGLVLKGRARIYTAPNLDGSQAIITDLGLGEMYGEPFNRLSFNYVPITVIARTPVKACILDLREILDADLPADIKTKVLNNNVIQFAEKIIVFRNKIEVLSQPSLKMKILTTIKHQSEYQGTRAPLIPFSKVEFAEYLCVNRNTLSKSLEKLEAEGELKIEGQRYELLKPENMMFNLRSNKSPVSRIHSRPH